MTSQPLAEQVKAKIIMYEEAAERAFNNDASERGMRYDARVIGLKQVLYLIEEKAKEIKERLDVTNNTPYSAQNPAIIAGRAQAYSDALALLIKKE